MEYKKKLRRGFRDMGPQNWPLRFLRKTWFRDNGQSLQHAFSKATELHRSSKIRGRENIFSAPFSTPDRFFFVFKDLKRSI